MDQEKEKEKNDTKLVHDFDSKDSQKLFSPKFIGLLFLVVILGIGTGYLLSSNKQKLGGSVLQSGSNNNSSSISKGMVEGSDDLKTFKDEAEGKLEKGGADGEGQYHLVRPGGASQNVYLTSSLVDLGKYEGRKVKVWGETQTAKKAGWLMDVGRVEVLE